MEYTEAEYIKINAERHLERARVYDPISGEGCDSCERVEFSCKELGISGYKVPYDCMEEVIFQKLGENGGSIRSYLKSIGLRYTKENVGLVSEELERARCKHDFEYFCARYVYIKDKNSEKDILFVLNRGQRKLLKAIYKYDKAHQPVRIILLKSRQWGGSTMTQIYFGWKQLMVLGQVHSVIVAHIENTARIIRGMYSKMLDKLPLWLCGGGELSELKLRPFERGNKTLIIKGIGCRITIGSAEKPNNIVGDDISMAHFSEVGLYKSTQGIKPEQLIQSVVSGISYRPDTIIVYESTARGVGNFFHSEWLRAVNGESVFVPVFVAWHYVDSDELPIGDMGKFIRSMSEEEELMFRDGATLEGIAWYRVASKQYRDIWRWRSERPSNPIEAFQSTGHRLYPQVDVERLRRGVREPEFVGDVYGAKPYGEEAMQDIKLKEEAGGPLKIWFKPDTDPAHKCNDRYVAVMDIGGGSEHSDRSVICVFDRYGMCDGGVPIVVAEWCGHTDHDLLAWKGVQLSCLYDNALLVIESNTLETEQTEGDHFDFILDEIAYYYDNLYCRVDAEKIKMGFDPRWGFHTNKSTKQIVCDHQKKALRENMYIETCREACDEHDFMEIKANGSIGAVEGQHDDRHITRAIGVWVCYDYLNAPRRFDIKENRRITKNRIINESSI